MIIPWQTVWLGHNGRKTNKNGLIPICIMVYHSEIGADLNNLKAKKVAVLTDPKVRHGCLRHTMTLPVTDLFTMMSM